MFKRFEIIRRRVGIDEFIAASSQTLQRRRIGRIEPRLEKARPIVRQRAVERGNDIVESVSDSDVAAVVDAEERARRIVERLLPARFLADQRVGVQPDSMPSP